MQPEEDSIPNNPFDLIYRYFDLPVFKQALTHTSYTAENLDSESYERLEFLGDSILGFVVSEYLFTNFPNKPEGELAKIKSQVVATKSLGNIAEIYNLGEFIFLGTGELYQNGRNKLSTLGDVVEALIAATYFSYGLDLAKEFILQLLKESINSAALSPGSQNYKSLLQELAVSRKLPPPRYDSYSSGNDHEKQYFVSLFIGDKKYGSGQASSKKAAEQEAAKLGFEKLKQTL